MNDTVLIILNNIRELGYRKDHPFSITIQEGWIRIAVGKHAYMAQTFSLETLINAYAYILSDLRKEENW